MRTHVVAAESIPVAARYARGLGFRPRGRATVLVSTNSLASIEGLRGLTVIEDDVHHHFTAGRGRHYERYVETLAPALVPF